MSQREQVARTIFEMMIDSSSGDPYNLAADRIDAEHIAPLTAERDKLKGERNEAQRAEEAARRMAKEFMDLEIKRRSQRDAAEALLAEAREVLEAVMQSGGHPWQPPPWETVRSLLARLAPKEPNAQALDLPPKA